MNPRLISLIKLLVAVFVIVGLIFLFPGALRFVELAAAELRYFWWLILLLLLAAWLIWGAGRKNEVNPAGDAQTLRRTWVGAGAAGEGSRITKIH